MSTSAPIIGDQTKHRRLVNYIQSQRGVDTLKPDPMYHSTDPSFVPITHRIFTRQNTSLVEVTSERHFPQLSSMWTDVTHSLMRKSVTSWGWEGMLPSASARVLPNGLVTVMEPSGTDEADTRRWHCRQLSMTLFGRNYERTLTLRRMGICSMSVGEYMARCPIDIHFNDDIPCEAVVVVSSSPNIDIQVLNSNEERYEAVGGERTILCDADGLFCVYVDVRKKFLVGPTTVGSPLRVCILGALPLVLAEVIIFMSPAMFHGDEMDRGMHVQRTYYH